MLTCDACTCCRDCTTVWQAVGERHGIEALKRLDPDPYGDTTYTANARERYEAAGFQVLTGSFFTGSDAHLLPGRKRRRRILHGFLPPGEVTGFNRKAE